MPEKKLFLWVTVTPVVMVIFGIIYLFTLSFAKINILNSGLPVIALSGFILNLVLLISVIQSSQAIVIVSEKVVRLDVRR